MLLWNITFLAREQGFGGKVHSQVCLRSGYNCIHLKKYVVCAVLRLRIATLCLVSFKNLSFFVPVNGTCLFVLILNQFLFFLTSVMQTETAALC